jgi:TPR repeat protein
MLHLLFRAHNSAECMADMQKHQRKFGDEAREAVGRNDRNAAMRAVGSLENSLTWSLCRARLPSTPQDSFAATLKNAMKGRAYAQHAVATKYESGNGTPKNLREAVKWLQKASE